MKRIHQLEAAWQQEAEAKAKRYIQSKYSRKERRFLSIIENFGQRGWLQAEKQYIRIAPKCAIKVRRLDTDAWIRRAYRQLERAMENGE